MSKSFVIFLKVMGIFVGVSYSILILSTIGGTLFSIGLSLAQFPSILHIVLILKIALIIVSFYVVVKLFHSQNDKKTALLSLLSVCIVLSFHYGFNMWADYINIRSEQVRQDRYEAKKIFIKEHCTAIDDNANQPVYRCDDGTIR